MIICQLIVHLFVTVQNKKNNKTHTTNRKNYLNTCRYKYAVTGSVHFSLAGIFRAATVQILERPQICRKPK